MQPPVGGAAADRPPGRPLGVRSPTLISDALDTPLMSEYDLDDVDKGLLHALQENARRITTEELGDRVGVSASTVRNRLRAMEDAGVIRGYHPEVDYARAGFDLRVMIFCRHAGVHEDELTQRVLDVEGVVQVTELLGANRDFLVEAIATDLADLVRIVETVDDLPMSVDATELFRRSTVQPFDHFGEEVDEG